MTIATSGNAIAPETLSGHAVIVGEHTYASQQIRAVNQDGESSQ